MCSAANTNEKVDRRYFHLIITEELVSIYWFSWFELWSLQSLPVFIENEKGIILIILCRTQIVPCNSFYQTILARSTGCEWNNGSGYACSTTKSYSSRIALVSKTWNIFISVYFLTSSHGASLFRTRILKRAFLYRFTLPSNIEEFDI